ncbi:MAG: UDP-N-acetylmuramoyl-L-alanine--D-glutamate ligase [Sphingomonadaceae bacterium]
MITSPAFRGKRYAVLGLARSGLATVRALVASGAEVVAWDSNEAARDTLRKILPVNGELAAPSADGGGHQEAPFLDTPLHHPAGGPPPRAAEDLQIVDPLTIDLTGFDGMVVSPGVPINRHPIADHARAAQVRLIGDIELFAQARANLPPHKVVGITGTNGKSTTTALIHHILQTAGVPSLMGGNIGLPILGRDPLPSGGVYVLELSSYQIDLTQGLDCDIAILLNITPDHLDRYDGFEHYVTSKTRLFEMQSYGHVAILGYENDEARRIHDALYAERSGGQIFGITSHDFDFSADEEAVEVNDFQAHWPSLQGPHNGQNAAAAIVACQSLGLSATVILNGLATYPGLPHRMERIRELNGILYVNDSKATNATSTAPALAAYPAIHWILGGQAKSDTLDACMPHINHVRAAYTIGDAGPMFAALLSPHLPVAECETLAKAVTDAHGAARPGDTVLLSPACASFDQFKDYEARGDAFRAAVEALK